MGKIYVIKFVEYLRGEYVCSGLAPTGYKNIKDARKALEEKAKAVDTNHSPVIIDGRAYARDHENKDIDWSIEMEIEEVEIH